MPITSITSYLTVAQQFIDHWTLVNVALGASPLLLKGGYTLALFTTDRNNLQTAITNVTNQNTIYQNSATSRDQKKAAISPRIPQFRAAVNYQLNGSVYVRSLPKTPTPLSAEGPFTDPLDKMAGLWAIINADLTVAGFTPPLLLVGGYTKAAFDTELTALRTAYRTVASAGDTLSVIRQRRDILLGPLKTRMLQYRTAVLAKFGPTDPFTLSLPKVTPDPGSTPQAVELSGSWNVVTGKANLQWTPSDNPNLSYYDVRYCPPPKYKASEEQSVTGGNVPKTQTQFETLTGLAASGAVAWFKVYVVTTDNNEKGSNAVKVTRP